MIGFNLSRGSGPLSVLCIGAHSDDIEIGVGGTILSLVQSEPALKVCWCVLSGAGDRASEARASADAFLRGAADYNLKFASFDDSFFPSQNRAIKQWLMKVRSDFSPDLIFTHTSNDAHQDHREVCQITWNVFRDNLILEYEIPKWDGDLARPNAYFPLSTNAIDDKIALLDTHFGTQRSKDWFDRETFRGLARIRGMECRAPERYAEAFLARKLILA